MQEIASSRNERRIQQVTFFLPNRLGTLRQAVARLEERGVRLRAISVLDAADHAVVRIATNNPAGAIAVLIEEGYGCCSTEILAVALPTDTRFGVGRMLGQLFAAEVSVEYLYSFHDPLGHSAVLALQVDSQDMAARVLTERGCALLGQDEL